jgi:polyvinyl alcohol dehydrogenase (cytochrome)
VLRALAPESIVESLTKGAMMLQASGLTQEQIAAVAGHVSSKPFGMPQVAQTVPNRCAQPARALRLDRLRAHESWNGWGRDLENSRYQPQPGFKASDVPRLKLKWAYAHAGRFAYGQPTIVGDRVLVANTLGEVRALDAATACERWVFEADAAVKAAISVASVRIGGARRTVAYFGDERSTVYAIDAETGVALWKAVVDAHPASRIAGAPVYHDGRLYTPISSAEESAARDPAYQCCTFRGAVAALDAASGRLLWKSHAIVDAPRPTRLNTAGAQMHGPAGAAIWSAPTVDPKRGVLYAATGNSYTEIDADGSNAIVAFDLATGARRWVNQLTRADNFVIGCPQEKAGLGNCPQQSGPDFDFGASTILRSLPARRAVLLAGQKSGVVYALDPDDRGKLLWQTRTGRGSALGGIEWGMAADDEYVYVANSDAGVREGALPGLTALRIADGAVRWSTPTPLVECSWGAEQCRRGQPGAVTLTPGVVFAGALDGRLRAYDTATGAIVWEADTSLEVPVVNGPPTAGGALDQSGPTIANGVVYVNSGYGRWGRPGRLLLAFSVDGK